jgi:aspartyl/asparaginyl beta-hydroxylase (cupin superfamily)
VAGCLEEFGVNSVARHQANHEQDPAQKFGTAGIKPMDRPSLVTRFFMSIVAWAEQLNLALSKVGNPSIYDNKIFPWTRSIENEWRTIRAELDHVLTRKDELPAFHELASDVETISRDRGWKSFLLAGYGFRSANNIKLCPETWRICQNIPGLITVMYSILEPGKHLPPHRGPYNGVLRLHLGLIVPEPREQLGIRVEHDVYRWREGEAVIFDDAYEHEAWNYTPHTRVVLFVDFRKPLRFPANVINWVLLHLAMFTPFIREGMDNQKAWEKKFYEEAEAVRNR